MFKHKFVNISTHSVTECSKSSRHWCNSFGQGKTYTSFIDVTITSVKICEFLAIAEEIKTVKRTIISSMLFKSGRLFETGNLFEGGCIIIHNFEKKRKRKFVELAGAKSSAHSLYQFMMKFSNRVLLQLSFSVVSRGVFTPTRHCNWPNCRAFPSQCRFIYTYASS